MTKNFMNLDTGELWTIAELKDAFADDEKHETFDEFLDDLLEQGVVRTGGLVPVYTVITVGGKNDGEVVFVTESESDAINFARSYDEEHEGDTGHIGVSIYNPEDIEVLNWI